MLLLDSHIHIYDNGAGLVSILLPILNALLYITGTVAIGLLLALTFLAPNQEGSIKATYKTQKDLAKISLFIWLVVQYGLVTTQIANLFQISVAQAFPPTITFNFLFKTGLGEAELISLIATAIALILTWIANRISTAIFALVFSILAMISPAFQAHASALSNHELAQGAIVFHVLAFTLWIGSIIGATVLTPADRKIAFPRISSIAWWSAFTVLITGLINTVTRLTSWNSLTTFYAILIYSKILLTGIVLWLGNQMRKWVKDGQPREENKKLKIEILIAVLVIALGGWLDTTSPPAPTKLFEPSLGYLTTGISTPPAPNLFRLFTLYNIDGLFLGLLIVIGILYFRGYKSLTQRGDIWPRGRSVSFISGWVLALYVSCGGLSIYAHYSFAYHMIAHMLMGMGVPILFTLSAPITLALRTLPTSRDGIELGLRQLLANILNSRYVRIISNPFVALGIFDGSLFLLYFTPLFGDLMLSHTGHFLMNLHFLLSGLLFFFIIIGVDPNPHKIPYIARIVLLAAAMSIHSFFSIAVLSSTTLMDHGYFTLLGKTWIGNYLADQHSAGAIGWAMSDLPILFALIATFVQWMRDDKKDADRFDRNSARAHAAGEEDELDKYNNYLASLNKLDRDH